MEAFCWLGCVVVGFGGFTEAKLLRLAMLQATLHLE